MKGLLYVHIQLYTHYHVLLGMVQVYVSALLQFWNAGPIHVE